MLPAGHVVVWVGRWPLLMHGLAVHRPHLLATGVNAHEMHLGLISTNFFHFGLVSVSRFLKFFPPFLSLEISLKLWSLSACYSGANQSESLPGHKLHGLNSSRFSLFPASKIPDIKVTLRWFRTWYFKFCPVYYALIFNGLRHCGWDWLSASFNKLQINYQ